ncbi:NUDIX hydrolase [Devosia sp. A16]|uniref:NUDIX hydrolase n=1 Tax=Devosia sp. A16 TaxID=1736675 RepID=UPI0006D7C59F|nr:NUDIX hydrolase [Devosia sp. A16]
MGHKRRQTEMGRRARQVAALPWRREADGSIAVLLITSRTNAKWMLPKGWAIPGKSDVESAVIEAEEEAGVTGIPSRAPIGSYFYVRQEDNGKTRPSQAVIYALEVTQELGTWDEKQQRTRRWFTAGDAALAVFERDLARFLGKLAAGRIHLA